MSEPYYEVAVSVGTLCKQKHRSMPPTKSPANLEPVSEFAQLVEEAFANSNRALSISMITMLIKGVVPRRHAHCLRMDGTLKWVTVITPAGDVRCSLDTRELVSVVVG